MNEIFLILEAVSVRLGGMEALDGLDWVIRRGEQWAVTGPSGSGKTVLAHTVQGRHFFSGRMEFLPATEGNALAVEGKEASLGGTAPGVDGYEPGMQGNEAVAEEKESAVGGKADPAAGRIRIMVVDQQHRFRNRPGTTDLYYQQRFNSSDAELTMTVAQELEQYTGKKWRDEGEKREAWLGSLHIEHLLDRPLIQLSNGENKRVQLAIALSEKPDLLILDNPFLGLDTEGRQVLHTIINMLAARGMQLLLITSPGELPEAITHVARLDGGKLVFTGPKTAFQALPAGEDEHRVQLDPAVLGRLQEISGGEGGAGEWPDFSVAVKMVNVHVHYGEKTLLDNINWEVKKGERWNVSGPNGAGKSTILSLITADNPQAYANDIWLFDRKRGTGETIWEIKHRIGFVSPELHLYFDYSATCMDVIASGLFDTIGLFRPLSAAQTEHTLLWMELLSLQELRTRRLAQLSTGQQRMVLLARALIKNPPMLILDEPCQGLDEDQTEYFRELIGRLCVAFGKTLIYVSHYKREIPDCVDKFLRLDQGRMVE